MKHLWQGRGGGGVGGESGGGGEAEKHHSKVKMGGMRGSFWSCLSRSTSTNNFPLSGWALSTSLY